MKQIFSHSTVLDLHFAFDKYVTVEENQSQKEIEKEILKEIETPMEVEVVEAISTENMMRMEEAANIAATAFGDNHVSVRTMRQEITKKRMEKKVKQTTLFQFVKKPTSASSVSPILSKPTFEGSPSFPCQFSKLNHYSIDIYFRELFTFGPVYFSVRIRVYFFEFFVNILRDIFYLLCCFWEQHLIKIIT